ncbi:amidinotransferase [Labilibacter sediminis]|nr:amidinotransferase [Labilibacter sediminis]
MNQSTSHIFLVRPANFNFNTDTAESNAFQHKVNLSPEQIKQKVHEEFDGYVSRLKENGVEVLVIDDSLTPVKPDAIFPNNWGSFHADGTVILYPMAAPNRRTEKRAEVIQTIQRDYEIRELIDLSKYENENRFLEGTGSIIFDHIHKIAYACLSPRTDKDILIEVCNLIDYTPKYFTSTDKNGKEIYHTNVMMCVSKNFSVICLESIKNEKERKMIIESLNNTGHDIIDISLEQVNHFAGNMLSVKNNQHKELLVMSQSAYDILTETQRKKLQNYCQLLPVHINTIETIGGGSARCMISEIFLKKFKP